MAQTTVPNPLLPVGDDISAGLKAALERAASLERVRALPCSGVCSTLTWPEGAFVCSAYNSEIDGLCTRHWAHDGDHVECTTDEHAVKTWPGHGRKAA